MIYMIYLGNNADVARRSQAKVRFIVQIEDAEFEKMKTPIVACGGLVYSSTFTGKVVWTENKWRFVDEVSSQFVNPFQDFDRYGWAQMIRIPKETVIKFLDKGAA